ncbi:hypothetical protein FXV83_16240 [Bradyrhizobium hipponense]|uniref:Uncharacterized protein n=1 Tax=Bradyrhizobium hipponense TaxID=2605638 RepID=A0A5S4YP99_9BRAD|nr:hypothetical protein [Bradyrhizobium hipponense]TYO65484.1 hypothetical protein FXV83_16240 [Bradyrhizobium hipponense]
MRPPIGYLQTQHDGSWVTPRDSSGQRLEFVLSRATLRQIETSPANARLVCVRTGRTLVTKATVRQVRTMLGHEPVEATPPVRPLIRKKPAEWFAPIVYPRPNRLLRSGHSPIVGRIMAG